MLNPKNASKRSIRTNARNQLGTRPDHCKRLTDGPCERPLMKIDSVLPESKNRNAFSRQGHTKWSIRLNEVKAQRYWHRRRLNNVIPECNHAELGGDELSSEPGWQSPHQQCLPSSPWEQRVTLPWVWGPRQPGRPLIREGLG